MSDNRNRQPQGTRSIKVSVPEDVAAFYEAQATRYSTSVSAAASPVLCAQARGEITSGFVKQPGTDTRPKF